MMPDGVLLLIIAVGSLLACLPFILVEIADWIERWRFEREMND